MTHEILFEKDFQVPVKTWTKDLPIEESALVQLRNMAKMPFIHKHISVMPDVHFLFGNFCFAYN